MCDATDTLGGFDLPSDEQLQEWEDFMLAKQPLVQRLGQWGVPAGTALVLLELNSLTSLLGQAVALLYELNGYDEEQPVQDDEENPFS